MAKQKMVYKHLSSEMMSELAKYTTDYIMENLRDLEEKIIAERHERQRASLKGALRRYRQLLILSETIVENATMAENELSVQDLLDMMNQRGKETIRLNAIRENAAMIRTMVNHLTNTLDSYRVYCQRSRKTEDMRRWRVLYGLYISVDEKTADELAECENVDRSTIYRDIDSAVEDLALQFFGVIGLDNL